MYDTSKRCPNMILGTWKKLGKFLRGEGVLSVSCKDSLTTSQCYFSSSLSWSTKDQTWRVDQLKITRDIRNKMKFLRGRAV